MMANQSAQRLRIATHVLPISRKIINQSKHPQRFLATPSPVRFSRTPLHLPPGYVSTTGTTESIVSSLEASLPQTREGSYCMSWCRIGLSMIWVFLNISQELIRMPGPKEAVLGQNQGNLRTHDFAWRGTPRLCLSFLLDQGAAGTHARGQAIHTSRSFNVVCPANTSTTPCVVSAIMREQRHRHCGGARARGHSEMKELDTYTQPKICHPQPPPMVCIAHTAIQSPLQES